MKKVKNHCYSSLNTGMDSELLLSYPAVYTYGV